MKLRNFAYTCGILLALAAIPSQLHADAFCSGPAPYQYQSCGTEAAPNNFTANALGFGVNMIFHGYHADFSSSVSALVFRGNTLVYTGASSPLNTEMHQYQFVNLVPAADVQPGDQIELVYHVNDPNGPQDYYSSELNKNIDGVNHLWAQALTDRQCLIIAGPCTYVGFEDLAVGEGADFDYNDFSAWIFGMHIDNGDNGGLSSGNAAVPEPSSIVLLTGAPLALVLRKLRRLRK
jgi:hypothetical protein